jgi:hypothetical protein
MDNSKAACEYHFPRRTWTVPLTSRSRGDEDPEQHTQLWVVDRRSILILPATHKQLESDSEDDLTSVDCLPTDPFATGNSKGEMVTDEMLLSLPKYGSTKRIDGRE